MAPKGSRLVFCSDHMARRRLGLDPRGNAELSRDLSFAGLGRDRLADLQERGAALVAARRVADRVPETIDIQAADNE